MSADAYHITATHPEGLGAVLVMENALRDAGLRPEDIDYINLHGTSTPVGDSGEEKAIHKVFGDHAYKLNLSSTKSMTGHLLGAAGALEAIFTVKAIDEDVIPRRSTTTPRTSTPRSTTTSTSPSTRPSAAPCAPP